MTYNFMTEQHTIVRLRLTNLLLLLALAIIDFCGLYCENIGINWNGLAIRLAVFPSVCFFLAIFLRRYLNHCNRPVLLNALGVFAVYLDILAQFYAFIFLMLIFSYIAIGSSAFPLIDDALLKTDRLLALDWPGYIAWVNTHATIREIFAFAYESFAAQMFFYMCILVFLRRYARLYATMMVFIVSASICILVAVFLPSVGMIPYFHANPADFAAVNLRSGYMHYDDFMALRNGTFRLLSFPPAGLITFPSFHAGCAIIYIWALWCIPYLRIPVAVLSLTMLVAVPVNGGHYFADCLGGIVITILTIAAVEHYTCYLQTNITHKT